MHVLIIFKKTKREFRDRKMRLNKKEAPQAIETDIKHIAFIMDGNGRWAKRRGLPREFGHRRGAETFKKVIEHCKRIGIKTYWKLKSRLNIILLYYIVQHQL